MRCETWFLTDKLYNAADKLYAAVIFEGEYLNYFKILEQYLDLSRMTSVQILQSSNCKMLAYYTTTFDNVQQVANIIKIFIELTFKIIQEKIYENN
ncbi:MAG: hypothetical protein IJT73_09360 [Selenomonadaceae bacterium]|nr:hypothetical protein [Selenomonadaceae bacterium]